ncbi:MAG TPA: hypothetical protein VH141_08650 [Pseudonocardia sp.]|nr:hypothetical protein [Pseudonocardia sp.]
MSVPLVSVVVSTRAQPVWLARAAVRLRSAAFVGRAAAVPDNAHQLHTGNSSEYRGDVARLDRRDIRLNLGNSLE